MAKNSKSNAPPCSDGTQAHHWILDSQNVGRCTKCGFVKDFSEKGPKGRDVPNFLMTTMRLPKAWRVSRHTVMY